MEIELNSKETRTFLGIRKILCRKGSIWITWPGSGDIILRENRELTINSRGKIFLENVGRNSAMILIQAMR